MSNDCCVAGKLGGILLYGSCRPEHVGIVNQVPSATRLRPPSMWGKWAFGGFGMWIWMDVPTVAVVRQWREWVAGQDDGFSIYLLQLRLVLPLDRYCSS
jgi:hypothetical protein